MGGVQPFNYFWSNGKTSPIIAGLVAGVYTVTVIDKNNCIKYDTVEVDHPDILIGSVVSNLDTFCYLQKDTLFAKGSGGNLPYTYKWNVTGSPTTPYLVIEPEFSDFYSVQVTDAKGCPSSQKNELILVHKPISANLFDSTICKEHVISLNPTVSGGNGNYMYNWSNGKTTKAINIAPSNSYPNSITYKLTVSDQCSPDTIIQSVISFNPAPIVDIGFRLTFGCEPFELEVNKNNSTQTSSCFWSFGDGNTSTECKPKHIYKNHGVYDVLYKSISDKGCVTEKLMKNQVVIKARPKADFTVTPEKTTVLNTFAEFQDVSTGDPINHWSWDFGDSVTVDSVAYTFHEYAPEAKVYDVQLIVTSIYNCKDTVVKRLIVDPDFNVHVPSVFTPNEDGKNDYFFPVGLGLELYEYEFYVFDRWGTKVFQSRNEKDKWDGTKDGKLLKEDVYVWKLYLKEKYTDKKEEKNLSGKILLLRKH